MSAVLDPRSRAKLEATGVDAVIFDLGNVLISWDPHPAIAKAVGAQEATRFLIDEEFDFAASLCDHPLDTLVALHRTYQDGEIRETFRTLRPKDGPKPLRAFAFLEVEGEDEPGDAVDLAAIAKRNEPDK